MIPLVGFLPATDPRVRGTVAAIEQGLVVDGFVQRYDTSITRDGLPPGEGTFLACTFWLADNLILQGRHQEAQALFDRLLGIRNDVGLLAEEYDPIARRQLGNFPQAFSHLALIGTALNLTRIESRPMRSDRSTPPRFGERRLHRLRPELDAAHDLRTRSRGFAGLRGRDHCCVSR